MSKPNRGRNQGSSSSGASTPEFNAEKAAADRKILGTSEFFVSIRWLIKWGSLVAIAYFVKESIEAVAGKSTDLKVLANIAVRVVSDRWVFLMVAIAVGVGQEVRVRNLKKRIGQMAAEKAKLEAILDPDRKSSTLLRTGNSRPEDTQ